MTQTHFSTISKSRQLELRRQILESVDENDSRKSLIKVVDVLGREISSNLDKLTLIYIYNDGSVEKKCIVD